VTIAGALAPALRAAFPDPHVRISAPPDPVAVFPAACAEVGEVVVYDDGDEATIIFWNVGHHHVQADDADLSEDERARWIAEQVVGFLRDLFADRVLLWSVEQGRGGGNWHRPWDGTIPAGVPDGADVFLWSRRIARTG
jgi:hypothetical protein